MKLPTIGAAVLAAAMTLAAGHLTAQSPPQDDSEKEIERYRQMLSDPFSNPGFLAVDRGEVLWAEPRGTKNVVAGGLRSRRGAGQARRRLRQAAALLRRCRPGHGHRAAPALVHGQGPGPRHQGRAGAPLLRPGPRLGSRGSDRLHRQQVERHEDRAAAQATPRRSRWRRSARSCSIAAAA